MKSDKKWQIGVIGSAGKEEYDKWLFPKDIFEKAQLVGELLAKNNCIVITGGKGGIMEAAAKGANTSGGITIGVIKGIKRFQSNEYTDIEVITGMEASGQDELNLVLMCDGLILLGGGAGSLQEAVIAYRNNIPIIALQSTGGWCDKICGDYMDDRKNIMIEPAKSPSEAVGKILKILEEKYAS